MIEYIIKSDGPGALSGGVSGSFSVPIKDELLIIPSGMVEISEAQNKLTGTFRLMDGKMFRIVNEEPPELGILKLIGLNNGNDTPNILPKGGTH